MRLTEEEITRILDDMMLKIKEKEKIYASIQERWEREDDWTEDEAMQIVQALNYLEEDLIKRKNEYCQKQNEYKF